MTARDYTDKLESKDLSIYFEQLQKLTTDLGNREIPRSERPETVDIFKKLLNRQVFGWPPKITPNVMHLIIQLGSLRTTFL